MLSFLHEPFIPLHIYMYLKKIVRELMKKKKQEGGVEGYREKVICHVWPTHLILS